jgi:hypothetical protein
MFKKILDWFKIDVNNLNKKYLDTICSNKVSEIFIKIN